MGLDPRFGGRGQLRPIAGHEPLRLAPEVLGRLGDEDLVVGARRNPAAAEAGRDHRDAGSHRFEDFRLDAAPQPHRDEEGGDVFHVGPDIGDVGGQLDARPLQQTPERAAGTRADHPEARVRPASVQHGPDVGDQPAQRVPIRDISEPADEREHRVLGQGAAAGSRYQSRFFQNG